VNDDTLLTAVRSSLTGVKDSLTDVHLDRPVSAITGRARARRLRRGLSAGAAAAVVLGAGLSLTLAAGPAASRTVHVNLDAWSVNTTSTGQVELTVRELQDQALLEQTLADAGVPAIVNFGEFCGAADQADNLTATTGTHFLGRPVTSGGALLAITIYPAAIPSGAKVDIGVEGIGSGNGIFVDEIIKDGAPLSCHPIKVRVKVTKPAGSATGG
jgi:hypothetical protein